MISFHLLSSLASHTTHATFHCISFYHDEEHNLNSPDSGKKRKLQYEQLGLPMSKHKFRDRGSSPAQGPLTPARLQTKETTEENSNFCRVKRMLDDGPDSSEGSSRDSNSFVTVDDEIHPEISSGSPAPAFGPSTSSSQPRDDGDFRSKLYSLDSRIAKNADPREKFAALEDEIQMEPEFEDSDEQLPAPGLYPEYIEECPDAAIQELMLYSNDVAPNTLAHPSGRWGLKQDACLGTRKPTIDQEFEQYFSMLML